MEDVTRQAETSLSKFSYALDQLEQTIRPVLKAIDELRASGNEDDLDAMSRARMHISLCYSVNALFCMYLRTQGVDPATHPVSEDIARVQDTFMRMRKVEAGISVDHQPPPDRDRRRHMMNAKKSAQKLASLVFPEEVDLLNAMRGRKRKREITDKGKEGEMGTEEKSELDSSEGEEDCRRRKIQRRERNNLSEDTKRMDDSTDSFSNEDCRLEGDEVLKTRKKEKTESPEEGPSTKKKKKKKDKKQKKHKSKDSSTDSKQKKSKDKKGNGRTPEESKRGKEKRKRKMAEERNP